MHLYYLCLFKYDIVDKFNDILILSHYFFKLALKSIATPLERKGKRIKTCFYGWDDGKWEAYPDVKMGKRSDWNIISFSPNVFSVEGATEYNAGFMKALQEIVQEYPELKELNIKFDGPSYPIIELIESSAFKHFDWENLILYHGTSEQAWKKIQQEGLHPRGITNVAPTHGAQYSSAPTARLDAIYLTTQLNTAHFAARDASNITKSPGVVLRIKGIKGQYAAADEDSRESDPIKSLGRIGAIAYLASIPASLIEPYEILENNNWRKIASQQDDINEPHSSSNGVLDKWQLDSLQDKHAWMGYQFNVSQWIWDAAVYGDQDEPDDWGDNGTGRISWSGPVMTLDEALEAISKAPFKWSTISDGTLESRVKKTKKIVVQGIARIERLDGNSLSYDEREHIKYILKI